MNVLIIFKNDAAYTSTIAIAEGVNNEHKAVIQLVRRYLGDLQDFGEVTFEMRLNPKGSPTEYALLNEQQATLILTYLKNTEIVRTFKKRLVKAFYELAHKINCQALDPTNLSRLQLLEMAMQAEQERLALEHKVEEMQPDVQALERLAKAEGSLCMTDAAKQLQIQPKKLFGFLFTHEWIFKRTGSSAWSGYQDKLRQGLIEHKIEVVQRGDGTDKLVTQVRITAKGMTKLAKMLDIQPA
jgi:phage regulator Rha-like protein